MNGLFQNVGLEFYCEIVCNLIEKFIGNSALSKLQTDQFHTHFVRICKKFIYRIMLCFNESLFIMYVFYSF